jgi:hypothetical protein
MSYATACINQLALTSRPVESLIEGVNSLEAIAALMHPYVFQLPTASPTEEPTASPTEEPTAVSPHHQLILFGSQYCLVVNAVW